MRYAPLSASPGAPDRVSGDRCGGFRGETGGQNTPLGENPK